MIKICGENIDKDYGAIAAAAFDVLGLAGEAAVDIEFVDLEEIARLNSQFRGKPDPTDVLSFPLLDYIKEFNKKNYPLSTIETGEVLLGGIAVCEEIAAENAKEDGHDTKTELRVLFIHGLLHLLGYDHMTEDEAIQMKKTEKFILEKAGFKL